LLEAPFAAFYDYRTLEPSADLDAIASKPVLFRLAVRRKNWENWEHIGSKPLEGAVAEPVVMFDQDVADFRRCTIWDTLGNARAATPEECVGIERGSVWDTHGIEERLLDTFMGRPNDEEVHDRVRLK